MAGQFRIINKVDKRMNIGGRSAPIENYVTNVVGSPSSGNYAVRKDNYLFNRKFIVEDNCNKGKNDDEQVVLPLIDELIDRSFIAAFTVDVVDRFDIAVDGTNNKNKFIASVFEPIGLPNEPHRLKYTLKQLKLLGHKPTMLLHESKEKYCFFRAENMNRYTQLERSRPLATSAPMRRPRKIVEIGNWRQSKYIFTEDDAPFRTTSLSSSTFRHEQRSSSHVRSLETEASRHQSKLRYMYKSDLLRVGDVAGLLPNSNSRTFGGAPNTEGFTDFAVVPFGTGFRGRQHYQANPLRKQLPVQGAAAREDLQLTTPSSSKPQLQQKEQQTKNKSFTSNHVPHPKTNFAAEKFAGYLAKWQSIERKDVKNEIGLKMANNPKAIKQSTGIKLIEEKWQEQSKSAEQNKSQARNSHIFNKPESMNQVEKLDGKCIKKEQGQFKSTEQNKSQAKIKKKCNKPESMNKVEKCEGKGMKKEQGQSKSAEQNKSQVKNHKKCHKPESMNQVEKFKGKGIKKKRQQSKSAEQNKSQVGNPKIFNKPESLNQSEKCEGKDIKKEHAEKTTQKKVRAKWPKVGKSSKK